MYTIIVTDNGYGKVTGSGEYEAGESVTLKAIANDGYIFEKWIYNLNKFDLKFDIVFGAEDAYYGEVFTFNMPSNDVNITAVFREKKTLSVNVTTDPYQIGKSVTVSNYEVIETGSVTLYAKQQDGYAFSHWSNGSTDNPLTLTNIKDNINIVAYYRQLPTESYSTRWKAFVKDQLDLNNKPIAFLDVVSFDVAEDLLTSATSSFDCLSAPDNISNGDIFVLTNPQGIIRYSGVITSISGVTIQTSQMQSFFKGTWLYDLPSESQNDLENIFLNAFNRYCSGKMKNSTFTDELVKTRLGGFKMATNTTTSGEFETQDDNYTMDMEQMIYNLYESYGIMVKTDINFSGDNNITIGKSLCSSIKVGNNTYSIINLSPVTKLEETNRVIIYSKDGAYRTTYVTKADGSRVEQPTSIANRYGLVNTKIVFSDDEIDTILEANLPSEMYNHKLTFTLRLNTYLYKYDDFVLGMPLQVWNDSEYFSTILTGRSFSKQENQNVVEVNYTCGKVRTTLTKKLLLRLGVK